MDADLNVNAFVKRKIVETIKSGEIRPKSDGDDEQGRNCSDPIPHDGLSRLPAPQVVTDGKLGA
jgi:hypothetical protein